MATERTHVHGYPDNEGEWFDDLLGRGAGDPDVYGYPEDPKARIENQYVIISEKINPERPL